MAFQKVQSERIYFKYKECKPGQCLVSNGIYCGPEEGKFGVQHKFQSRDDGKITILNSSGHLNWLLEEHVEVGSVVNVYYREEITLTKGAFKGKPAHNFDLEVDDTGVITKYADAAPTRALAPISEENDIKI